MANENEKQPSMPKWGEEIDEFLSKIGEKHPELSLIVAGSTKDEFLFGGMHPEDLEEIIFNLLLREPMLFLPIRSALLRAYEYMKQEVEKSKVSVNEEENNEFTEKAIKIAIPLNNIKS